jgi:hypothetical protein
MLDIPLPFQIMLISVWNVGFLQKIPKTTLQLAIL